MTVSGEAAELGPRWALITGIVDYVEIQRSIIEAQDKDSHPSFCVMRLLLFTVYV